MTQIEFPPYSDTRCLMMPYIQGDPDSVPDSLGPYRSIISSLYLEKNSVGYLTVDEAPIKPGSIHRGDKAQHDRALHTEAGWHETHCGWGPHPGWGGKANVRLEEDLEILIASNRSQTCAVWDQDHADTSGDGDIGFASEYYRYSSGELLRAGEVKTLGVFTPHESLPIPSGGYRQFLRIVGDGVYGSEPYFTVNPLLQKGNLHA